MMLLSDVLHALTAV